MESMLKRHPLKPGEVIFIPGGLVHTIDRGSFLFEVQQNSDTTYRLWDWGRVDGNGKPRELHLQQAMASMENGVHASVIPLRIAPRGQNPETPWMANELFVAKTLTVTKTLRCDTQNRCFDVLFTARGRIRIHGGRNHLFVAEGRTVLIPASLGEYCLEAVDTVDTASAQPTAEVLCVTM